MLGSDMYVLGSWLYTIQHLYRLDVDASAIRTQTSECNLFQMNHPRNKERIRVTLGELLVDDDLY